AAGASADGPWPEPLSTGAAEVSADGEVAIGEFEYFQCKDLDEACPEWSQSLGQAKDGPESTACVVKSAFMSHNCPVTCGTCDIVNRGYEMSHSLEGGLKIIPFCQDNDFKCREYAGSGECEKNPEYMAIFCEASCGVCSEASNRFGVGQKLHKKDPETARLIEERLEASIDYMTTVRRDRKYKKLRKDCFNMVPDCTRWAAKGECEKNEQYMKWKCAPACLSCHSLGDTSETCPGLPEGGGALWKPGDLNAFFEEVVDGAEGFYEQLKPKALSRPKLKSDDTPVPGLEKDGPWVVLFEAFLTDEEADQLIRIGNEQGFERSVRAVEPDKSMVVEGRTSTNTWCKASCMEDPIVARVLERIAIATKSTEAHGEHLQLLRYEEGQRYDGHDDFIPYQLGQPCGARIMTLFLYLIDVEEGGKTTFPELDISVKPKKGRALLWPNVKDENPEEQDPRMAHSADAVVRGVKYAANAWIHSEDFQTPLALGCLK
ncbi:hypothetical protein ACHAWF_001478, partial [Thalassiosira exigua]